MITMKPTEPPASPERCYLCNNDSFDLVTSDLRYSYEGSIFRCQQCKNVFLYPGMDAEREKTFYEQEYGDIFSSEKGTTPESLFHARLPDARIYLDWVHEWLSPEYECLEIGCASGYFLHLIQNSVRKVAGVESHHLLRSYCSDKGIEMYDSISDCESQKFDLVFLFFVLEHIGDPLSLLHELARIIKPGGQLVIVVPNIDDALLKLYDIPEIIPFYYTPAHQYYYNKDTLSLLFNRSGTWKDTMIIPKQRYDLSNHMNWMQKGKPGGQGKYNGIFSKELNEEYAACLNKEFLCDTLLLKAIRM